ncbi:hypothetical protein [Streptomyces sp. NPDC090025]|uniref:hypothetical protein n=1 Tax=Streptomyces sp. NPDC090025 TaxID=3365922 RepID=UPI0038394BE8
MSARVSTRISTTARQFTLALVACLAVAGGAALAVSGDSEGSSAPQVRLADDNWPVPTKAPGH